MRKILCAAAFMLALCGPAFAGDIPNPLAPQTSTGITVEEQAAAGDMQNGIVSSLSEAVLSVIESVRALL